MPPKRKAASRSKTKTPPKKAKTVPSVAQQAIKALQTAEETKNVKSSKQTRKVDKHCSLANLSDVVDDYDCMLNLANIGKNNNKFYVIQVLKLRADDSYYAWNRWGRVGEAGANSIKGPWDTVDTAIKDFEKKYKDKTKNAWSDRADFKPVSGKYTLIEMGEDDDDGEEAAVPKLISTTSKIVKPCALDVPTQNLLKLILDTDMFKSAMAKFDIDVKKMPLGKLSKSQIAKGYECLEEIEGIVKKSKKGNLTELSSKFYTLIPHNFGRQRPPVINDIETVQSKYDMLAVLGDIEIAQQMSKEKDKKHADKEVVPHPLDVDYSLLNCKLDHVPTNSQEFKLLEEYTEKTKSRQVKLLEAFKVDRLGEAEKFNAFKSLKNRKLLWHGTNIAVVAAILKTGLRIMPHSGGRVGRGIYFASENGKSSWYVSPSSSGIGIMFLNEVALGIEHHITRDDSSLTQAPKGKDCVIAKGRKEPDPKQDTSIKIEGSDVVVPKGKPVAQSTYKGSSFDQSEYLVYNEGQARLRYLLKMKF